MGAMVTSSTVRSDAMPEFAYPYYNVTKSADVNILQVGPTVGATVGCDRQFGGMVLGVLSDFDYTPVESKGMTAYSDPWVHEVRLTNHYKGGLYGRIGGAFGDTLVYAKLGVTASRMWYRGRYGSESLTYDSTPSPDPTANPDQRFPHNFMNSVENDGARWILGPTIGLGVEHLLSSRWSVKGEIDATWLPPTRSDMIFDPKHTNIGGTGVWSLPADGKWGYLSNSLMTNVRIGVNYRM